MSTPTPDEIAEHVHEANAEQVKQAEKALENYDPNSGIDSEES